MRRRLTHASLCAVLRRLDAALELEEYTARGERRLMVLHADGAGLRVSADARGKAKVGARNDFLRNAGGDVVRK